MEGWRGEGVFAAIIGPLHEQSPPALLFALVLWLSGAVAIVSPYSPLSPGVQYHPGHKLLHTLSLAQGHDRDSFSGLPPFDWKRGRQGRGR